MPYLGSFFLFSCKPGAIWVQLRLSLGHQMIHELSGFFLLAWYQMAGRHQLLCSVLNVQATLRQSRPGFHDSTSKKLLYDPYLKWAFVEAANAPAQYRKHPHWQSRHVTHLHQRVRLRKGHSVAVGTVARHLKEATLQGLRISPGTPC